MKTTIPDQTQSNLVEPTLYMALELGEKSWKLGFSVGLGQKARLRNIVAGDRRALKREVQRGKRRFGLKPQVTVWSCYEAGREGFWLHRYLRREGIHNHVIDSSSIEVNRRARRAKSDGLDARKLVEMLIRYGLGETRVWRVVRVPSRQDEDDRHLHRGLKTLKRERTAVGNRVRGLLKTQGITWVGSMVGLGEAQLETLRDWEGAQLRVGLKGRLATQIRRYQELTLQIGEIQKQRRQQLRESAKEDPKLDQIRALESLKGIGINGAWTLVMEAFSWRDFRNRRQVGGFVGQTPSPFQSGRTRRE